MDTVKFFFFQAEDGIRDRNVTGVQTCALPIYGEGIGTGMLIGIESCERLQDRRCHLENQRDDAYLCKRKVELILHNRIDGRNNRLNHIVQEMGNATDDEHGIYRALYHLGITLDFVTDRKSVV